MIAGVHKIHARVIDTALRTLGNSVIFTALLALSACDSRQAQALRELETSGVEVNNERLHQALASRDHKTSALLLESGICGNSADPSCERPLAKAVKIRDADSLFMLLNAGADPSAKNSEKGHILGAAAFSGQFELLDTLLAAGADPVDPQALTR